MALAVSASALTAVVVLAVSDANAEAERAEIERLEQLQEAAVLAAAEARAAKRIEAEVEPAELVVLGPPVPPVYVELPDLAGMSMTAVGELFDREGLTLLARLDGEPLERENYRRYRVPESAGLPRFVEPGAALVVPVERKPRPRYKKKFGRGY